MLSTHQVNCPIDGGTRMITKARRILKVRARVRPYRRRDPHHPCDRPRRGTLSSLRWLQRGPRRDEMRSGSRTVQLDWIVNFCAGVWGGLLMSLLL